MCLDKDGVLEQITHFDVFNKGRCSFCVLLLFQKFTWLSASRLQQQSVHQQAFFPSFIIINNVD